MSGWREISIAGYPCDIYEPIQVHPQGYVVIYLHGVHLRRLADHRAYEEQFARYGLRVMAPWTGRCWWLDRLCPDFSEKWTPEQHLLQNVLPWVDQHWDCRPPRLALFGTSMGGQGALRLAYKYPDRFPVVAAISPAIDFHQRWQTDPILQEMFEDPESARQETALLYVHPLNWPRHQFFCCDPIDTRWWDSAERLRMKLASLGIPFTCDLETSGGGHSFEYYERMAARVVAFLVEGLEHERLRLPVAGS